MNNTLVKAELRLPQSLLDELRKVAVANGVHVDTIVRIMCQRELRRLAQDADLAKVMT